MSSLYTEATVLRAAQDLIAYAQAVGVVVTIDLKPHKPLAMGNYEMVASTRQARHQPTVQRLPADDTEGGAA